MSLTKAEARALILQALTRMPDEAFASLVLAATAQALTKGSLCQIWPDRLEVFTWASRVAIEDVRSVADAYLAR